MADRGTNVALPWHHALTMLWRLMIENGYFSQLVIPLSALGIVALLNVRARTDLLITSQNLLIVGFVLVGSTVRMVSPYRIRRIYFQTEYFPDRDSATLRHWVVWTLAVAVLFLDLIMIFFLSEANQTLAMIYLVAAFFMMALIQNSYAWEFEKRVRLVNQHLLADPSIRSTFAEICQQVIGEESGSLSPHMQAGDMGDHPSMD